MDGFVNQPRKDGFKKCFRCQGTDTDRIFLGYKDNRVSYVGWCNICNREYSYSERITDVYDKEERI